jgi:hypothetical protein
MNIPGGLILIFISLSLFYYFNQKARQRREARKDRLEQKQQELIEMSREKNKEEPSQE